MIRILLTFFLSSVLTLIASGQNSGFLSGYIITNSSDTVRGYVKYINQVPYRVLPDIKFKETESSKDKKYTPNDLLGYKAGDKIFHSLVLPNGNSEKQFMELVKDGYIKIYEASVTSFGAPSPTVPGSGTNSYEYLLKTGDDKLFEVNGGKFKERLSEYLSDNKEIADKIISGTYKRKNLKIIVEEYNKGKQIN